ncbi:MAG: TIGR04013 family B12-binding domain/radical SAM domain-containing protein [Candidatus Hodarchaeales archaeon]
MEKKSSFLARIRSRNWYSYAPILSSLKASGFNDFVLIKKLDSVFVNKIRERLTTSDRVFYLESYKTMESSEVESEISTLCKLFNRESYNKRLFFIAGGTHPTGDPESALKAGFDFVIRGEGEEALPQLVSNLLQEKKIDRVPGLSYICENDQIHHNALGKPVMLDKFDPFINLPEVKLSPPIEIMRGCYFYCKFCQVPWMYSKVRFRSVEAIEGIVKHYAEVFKNQKSLDIRFIAPNFLGYGSSSAKVPDTDKLWKIVAIGEKYRARLFMGSFPGEVRPESINSDSIEVLKESHSRNVAIGAQSGSERMLKIMRRGHGIAEVHEACRLLTNNGFVPHVDFMLGLPGEKREEMFRSLEMMRELVKMGCKIRGHHFLPLPGTPWANERPSEVPNEVSVEMGRLAKQKSATGCFERQKASITVPHLMDKPD